MCCPYRTRCSDRTHSMHRKPTNNNTTATTTAARELTVPATERPTACLRNRLVASPATAHASAKSARPSIAAISTYAAVTPRSMSRDSTNGSSYAPQIAANIKKIISGNNTRTSPLRRTLASPHWPAWLPWPPTAAAVFCTSIALLLVHRGSRSALLPTRPPILSQRETDFQCLAAWAAPFSWGLHHNSSRWTMRRADVRYTGGQKLRGGCDMKLDLTSTAFKEGEPIPKQYTGDGRHLSPPLAWDDPPAGT